MDFFRPSWRVSDYAASGSDEHAPIAGSRVTLRTPRRHNPEGGIMKVMPITA